MREERNAGPGLVHRWTERSSRHCIVSPYSRREGMVELIRNYGSSSVNSELFISYERWKRFYREQFLQAHVMHACTHARSHTHTHRNKLWHLCSLFFQSLSSAVLTSFSTVMKASWLAQFTWFADTSTQNTMCYICAVCYIQD